MDIYTIARIHKILEDFKKAENKTFCTNYGIIKITGHDNNRSELKTLEIKKKILDKNNKFILIKSYIDLLISEKPVEINNTINIQIYFKWIEFAFSSLKNIKSKILPELRTVYIYIPDTYKGKTSKGHSFYRKASIHILNGKYTCELQEFTTSDNNVPGNELFLDFINTEEVNGEKMYHGLGFVYYDNSIWYGVGVKNNIEKYRLQINPKEYVNADGKYTLKIFNDIYKLIINIIPEKNTTVKFRDYDFYYDITKELSDVFDYVIEDIPDIIEKMSKEIEIKYINN